MHNSKPHLKISNPIPQLSKPPNKPATSVSKNPKSFPTLPNPITNLQLFIQSSKNSLYRFHI